MSAHISSKTKTSTHIWVKETTMRQQQYQVNNPSTNLTYYSEWLQLRTSIYSRKGAKQMFTTPSQLKEKYDFWLWKWVYTATKSRESSLIKQVVILWHTAVTTLCWFSKEYHSGKYIYEIWEKTPWKVSSYFLSKFQSSQNRHKKTQI